LQSAFYLANGVRGALEQRMKLIIGTGAGRKKNMSLLPVLVGLFVISYGLLTTLVVLQDRTIDSQRTLIQQLFQDSVQLSAMKMHHATPAPKANPAHAANTPKAPAPQSENAQVQPQAVPQQVPSAETQPPMKNKSQKNSKKVERSHPMQPPAELTDPSDKRRVKYVI
jgi:hypothetical protein